MQSSVYLNISTKMLKWHAPPCVKMLLHLGLQNLLRSSSKTLKIGELKKEEVLLVFFPDVSSDKTYFQTTHHGILKENEPNDQELVSWCESPFCAFKEITLKHTHTHTHVFKDKHIRDWTLIGVSRSSGTMSVCVSMCAWITMCPLTWALMDLNVSECSTKQSHTNTL